MGCRLNLTFIRITICPVIALYAMISQCTFAYGDEIGLASFYTAESCRREGTSGTWTASGERFDEQALTCAMRRRDWGSLWRVTSLETGMDVVVRLNDYGPGKGPTAKGVIVDLSPRAMRAIAPKGVGMVRVKVERVS